MLACRRALAIIPRHAALSHQLITRRTLATMSTVDYPSTFPRKGGIAAITAGPAKATPTTLVKFVLKAELTAAVRYSFSTCGHGD